MAVLLTPGSVAGSDGQHHPREGAPGTSLPIVYVRGYAGSTGGINAAVDDPFYGFNIGATHVRVGGDGEPHFYQFESPLLRLLIDSTDDGGPYRIFVRGGQEAYLDSRGPGTIDPKTVWIPPVLRRRRVDIWEESPQVPDRGRRRRPATPRRPYSAEDRRREGAPGCALHGRAHLPLLDPAGDP